MSAASTPRENPVGHVVSQQGVVHPLTRPRPVRFRCPKRNDPRPAWLPPDQFCCGQDHYLQGTYGITCDDWWALHELQGGRCGICWGAFKAGQRVVVDHDHDTGTVDGLAHFGCNRRLRQDHRRYAKNPPGAALGLRVAPAKLREIQAKDAVKRRAAKERREQARKQQAPAVVAGDGAGSHLDRLRAMSKGGST